ncbi:hypothetical protein F4803DRAFT_544043 [Xylaria telfairii]|nr:hypothetical protein F4803DRAFT_544043 [Xylaria telfairii]
MSLFPPSFGRKLLAVAAFLVLGVGAECTRENCYRSEGSTLSTRTTTPTQDYFVPNGDFECGLTPWIVQVPDSAITYSVAGPGYASSNSFQVKFTPPSARTESGVSARIISAPVRVVPNVPYQLSFWTYFDNAKAGFIGVQFNNVPKYTIDATDHGYGGNFTLNTVNYTPTNDTVAIKFEYLFGGSSGVASLDRIDRITFAPVQ